MPVPKYIAILNIIANELKMPKDCSFGDIMLCLSAVDENNEIRDILIKEMCDEVIKRIKKEIA